VVANCKAALVVVQGPEVYRPQPGDTEGWLRSVFEEAADLAQEGECVCDWNCRLCLRLHLHVRHALNETFYVFLMVKQQKLKALCSL
jgi:hypothetical protein